eukprot:3976628-Pleurochrysis_carterae.AAC.1
MHDTLRRSDFKSRTRPVGARIKSDREVAGFCSLLKCSQVQVQGVVSESYVAGASYYSHAILRNAVSRSRGLPRPRDTRTATSAVFRSSRKQIAEAAKPVAVNCTYTTGSMPSPLVLNA